MTSRFRAGTKVYDRQGQFFTVEAVDGETVYCTAVDGGERELRAADLFTTEEWDANGGSAPAVKRREIPYSALKQSRVYATARIKVDPDAAQTVLTKADRTVAGLLDFVAFTVAEKLLNEIGAGGLADELSIVKSRALFDSARPDVRVNLLADVVESPPDSLIEAARLGESLLRAMIEKGMAAQSAAFEEFCDRPRR